MIGKVALPKVDANVIEMAITRWIKKDGDAVRKGEPLVELTTEKATFELESPFSGTVRKTLAEEKSVLPVGYVIALVGGVEDSLPDVSAANRRVLERHWGAAARAPVAAPVAKTTREMVRATPAARRLARERGLSLEKIRDAMKADVVRESTIEQFLERNQG